MTRLRNMQAEYFKVEEINVVIGKTIETICNAVVFKSYDSICAIYNPDSRVMYLLPHYDYSVTTLKQLRAFVDDVANVSQFDLKRLRKQSNDWCFNCLYILCDGFYYPQDLRKW